MTDDYYPKDGPSVHSRNVDYIPGKLVKKEEAEKAGKKEEIKEEIKEEVKKEEEKKKLGRPFKR